MARPVWTAIVLAAGIALGIGGTALAVPGSTDDSAEVDTPAPPPDSIPDVGPDANVVLAPPPTSRQPASESSFIPISACRIADTRKTTPLPANGTRTFYVGGTTGFVPQGGTSGGCGIPVGATAIALSATAADGSRSGNMLAYPNGGSTTSGFINVTPGEVTRASGNIAINSSSAYALKITNRSAGTANIVLDVQGYYVKPLAGMISETGAPYAGSSRITGSVRAAQGIFDVTFDRNIVYCSPAVTVYFDNYYANADTYALGSNTVRVKVYDATGVLRDAFFYISVEC
jgi:hypothetical protein